MSQGGKLVEHVALLGIARSMLEGGADWDVVLRELRDRGASPIACIKVFRELKGVSLAEAKEAVHLSEAWADMRETHDALHSVAELAGEQVSNPNLRANEAATPGIPLSPSAPWIYRTRSDESALASVAFRAHRLANPRDVVRFVRGSRMHTFAPFFDEISAALQFPYYFGNNFNALDECITDLEWIGGTSYILIIIDAVEVLSKEEDDDRVAFLRLLNRASEVWAQPVERGKKWDRPAVPFHSILHYSDRDVRAFDRLLAAAGIDAPLVTAEELY